MSYMQRESVKLWLLLVFVSINIINHIRLKKRYAELLKTCRDLVHSNEAIEMEVEELSRVLLRHTNAKFNTAIRRYSSVHELQEFIESRLVSKSV
jgi:hypothetical protein